VTDPDLPPVSVWQTLAVIALMAALVVAVVIA
jgi:hypothetical protein